MGSANVPSRFPCLNQQNGIDLEHIFDALDTSTGRVLGDNQAKPTDQLDGQRPRQ